MIGKDCDLARRRFWFWLNTESCLVSVLPFFCQLWAVKQGHTIFYMLNLFILESYFYQHEEHYKNAAPGLPTCWLLCAAGQVVYN